MRAAFHFKLLVLQCEIVTFVSGWVSQEDFVESSRPAFSSVYMINSEDLLLRTILSFYLSGE